MYVNLQPPNTPPPHEDYQTIIRHQRNGGWTSFWFFGVFPREKRVDAAMICGGTDHIASIETRQTFWQGLVGAVAGFGYYISVINVYAPYGGKVNCDHTL
jgi:hypothetical protein